ncbi:response regulator [Paenibacillus sp. SYP-B3998]|uniref:Circadian input-output histidine kinase CikA n=1 Tax=Paenibacillus sp. SYP-B3998 TaxID=2678564 RepID=A0A6G3ZYP8_9BACL|nr:ATP-binding protein [Paenibacillus sp. SYP-B3998]NEW06527.1 response regulator [Paenibacillus sp. SYP-B3998]
MKRGVQWFLASCIYVAFAQIANAQTEDLGMKLKICQETYQAAVIGDEVDEYPKWSMDELKVSMDAAQSLQNNPQANSHENEVVMAQLTKAMNDLTASKITKIVSMPEKPVLIHDNTTGDTSYNMWWGNNGTEWKLYEKVDQQDFHPIEQGNAQDLTPNPQKFKVALKNKDYNTYTYYAELSNSYGVTKSAPLTITLKEPNNIKPGKLDLRYSPNQNDGYEVAMNMWQGSNGTSWKLYEKKGEGKFELFQSGNLIDRTPEAQTITQTFRDKAYGTYFYYAELSNKYGVSQSDIIKVEHAAPWWLTGWAKTLFILILAAVTYMVFSMRLRGQRLKLDTQERELQWQYEFNRQLQQLNARKDEFLTRTSHELRTPLHGMIGIAESIVDRVNGDPKAIRKDLQLIISSGQRLSRLVNDILDFHQLKHNELDLSRKSVDMQKLVDVVFQQLYVLTRGKDVELENRLEADLSFAYVDEDRMFQVMHNIIGNAIKFTPSGSIVVSGKFNRHELEITIEDTGIGIPEDQLDVIFMPFEQGVHPQTGRYEGTGLGLSITKQLIELHGGRLTVQSQKGQGSRFVFNMPIDEVNNAVAPRSCRPERTDEQVQIRLEIPLILDEPGISDVEGGCFCASENKSFRILVVDDDAVNLQIIANHLSAKSWEVKLALDGREAFELMVGTQFDLILLDIMMPHMSGYDVCQQIRARNTLNELPILLLTARSNPEDVAEGFRCGANDYMVKPFTKQELLARIETHLALADGNRQLRMAKMSLEGEIATRLKMDVLLGDLSKIYKASHMHDKIVQEIYQLTRIEQIEMLTYDLQNCTILKGLDQVELLDRHRFDQFLASKCHHLTAGEWMESDTGCLLLLGGYGQVLHLLWLPTKLSVISFQDKLTLQLLSKYTAIFYENLYLISDMVQHIADLQQQDATPQWMSKLFMQISEHERRRLSSDLHDEVLQEVLRMGNELGRFQHTHTTEGIAVNWEKMKIDLENLAYLIRETCSELLPTFLADKGIAQAIRKLADKVQLNHNFQIRLMIDDMPLPLQGDEALTVYRVVQELFTNAGKHAEATEVRLALLYEGSQLLIRYNDNGKGMRLVSLSDETLHYGLKGIRERIHALAGQVEVISEPGAGFSLLCRFPLHYYNPLKGDFRSKSSSAEAF